jgi:hypothetical protein
MKTVIIGCLLLLTCRAAAQEKGKSSKPGVAIYPGISLVTGAAENSWQWQVVGAVVKKNWVAGIGAGMDYYRYRTVPVFLSVRREELFRRLFFGYAGVGLTIPAVTDGQKKAFTVSDKFYTGVYAETGVGIRIPVRGKWSARVSLGYGFKSLREKAVYPDFSGSVPPLENVISYRHSFQLVHLRTVIGFRGR